MKEGEGEKEKRKRGGIGAWESIYVNIALVFGTSLMILLYSFFLVR